MKLDGARLRLTLGLGLLPVLILAGRVAPLTRGRGRNGARLRPGGDGGRRWCRWRRYRDIGKGAQAGRGRAQGHRTRRRRQWKEGRRRTVCLTRLLTEIVVALFFFPLPLFFSLLPLTPVESSINQLASVHTPPIYEQRLTSDVNLFLPPRPTPSFAFSSIVVESSSPPSFPSVYCPLKCLSF